MKKTLYLVICLFAPLCGTALAQNPSPRDKDEAAIRAVVVELSEAWTTADAERWGRQFTSDVDYMAVNAVFHKGREANVKAHQALFTGRFKDTKAKYEVQSIRFLSNDIAVVHVKASMVPKNEEFRENHLVPVMIFTKEKSQWLISVFQNLSFPPTTAEIKKICAQHCGK
ncbi:MAG TPA: SgcJ/EcaC family oxidoreductase [Blastocatellia bacterium]|nr:SgcJ/EcaC family oxidoreductase [Blastocatellia bacterium]